MENTWDLLLGAAIALGGSILGGVWGARAQLKHTVRISRQIRQEERQEDAAATLLVLVSPLRDAAMDLGFAYQEASMADQARDPQRALKDGMIRLRGAWDTELRGRLQGLPVRDGYLRLIGAWQAVDTAVKRPLSDAAVVGTHLQEFWRTAREVEDACKDLLRPDTNAR
jgi:hypothetical protein